MSFTDTFIHRPVATTLATLAIALSGVLAYMNLPVSPLPQVDMPSISVSASLPGASPETMAATVATPLERTLGRIAGITEMTSSSSLGNTSISLQFDISRDVDSAARDVQAAINAARSLLPTGMPGNPTYRKMNSADSVSYTNLDGYKRQTSNTLGTGARHSPALHRTWQGRPATRYSKKRSWLHGNNAKSIASSPCPPGRFASW